MDEGWKTLDVEPEVNGSNGNGRHNATGIEQTVELVLENGHHTNGNGNGHADVPINGNGANDHHDDAPEPQKALFSWAEFMTEEPVKPKGRSRKPQPASASLFEWALSIREGDGRRLCLTTGWTREAYYWANGAAIVFDTVAALHVHVNGFWRLTAHVAYPV